MKKIYFAYGMNMDRQDMEHTCPVSEFLGLGVLHDHRLLYKGYGHADVVPAEIRAVPVAIFEISESDEAHLDIREGYPSYYIKKQVTVEMTCDKYFRPCENKEIKGMVYKMADGFDLRLPSRGYEAIIRRAYEDFGLEQSILDEAYDASKNKEKKSHIT